MPTIEEELEVVSEYYPGFAPVIMEAIEDGNLYGGKFVSQKFPGCGCFYGHLGKLDEVKAISLARDVSNELHGGIGTPIQILIIYVKQGMTHKTSPELATLYEAVKKYLRH